jgi:phospholipid/cholesterol/gamma-HCH transport system permease protein
LVSTRVVAGMVLVIPLFCVASEAGYLAARLLALSVFDIPAGTYDHYFSSYLKSTDLLWSLLEATATGVVVMLVHTYYGFNAFGGPAGVGLATGRAVRASLIVSEFATLAVALAVYGASGDFHLTG